MLITVFATRFQTIESDDTSSFTTCQVHFLPSFFSPPQNLRKKAEDSYTLELQSGLCWKALENNFVKKQVMFLHVYNSSDTCGCQESYFVITSASDTSLDLWHSKPQGMTNDV